MKDLYEQEQQLERERRTVCNKEGCSKPAEVRVSDGPEGLSPRTNTYYLCWDHIPKPGSFENTDILENK